MDKIWDRNPSKLEVIGRCSGEEKNEWSRRTDKSRTLKEKEKNCHRSLYISSLRYTYITLEQKTHKILPK